MFLDYVLVRRLQNKMETIYCDRPQIAYMFSKDGVKAIDLKATERIPELDETSLCSALVNLGDALEQPPLHFYPTLRLGRVVIATSPNPNHLGHFREHEPAIYYMPLWNWNDLYCGR
jgi:hypothetical protein